MAVIVPSDVAAQVDNNLASGVFQVKKAPLAVNDTTAWIKVFQDCTISLLGGATLAASVDMAFEADQSDSIVVGAHTESDRSATYRVAGECWIRVRLTAVTSGPVTAYISYRGS